MLYKCVYIYIHILFFMLVQLQPVVLSVCLSVGTIILISMLTLLKWVCSGFIEITDSCDKLEVLT